ncbi:MAG: transcription initiation factor IIB [Stictis urceolatum]|nr:transcription initiation factor IIB [Stictis urceolata]
MATLVDKADEPWEENLNMHMICPDCKVTPPNLIEEYSSGDMVCGDCGLVLGARIVDTRSEWRTFSNDDQNNDDPSRVGDGPNLLLNGDQLQTTISFSDKSKSKELHRAQNRTSNDKGNKALLSAYKEIGAMCDAIHLSKTVSDTVKHLFKMVNDAGAFRGKSQETVIAGCIFIACRQCKVPRTFREVFALTNVPKKEIGRIFKALEKFFAQQNEEKQLPAETREAQGTSTNASELCIRFCSALGLNGPCTKVSQALAEKMGAGGALAGRSPLSAAAACIYFASHLMKQPKTAKEISQVAGVSDGTIRTSYKLLEAEKEKLVDPEWLKDGKGDMSLLPKV